MGRQGCEARRRTSEGLSDDDGSSWQEIGPTPRLLLTMAERIGAGVFSDARHQGVWSF